MGATEWLGSPVALITAAAFGALWGSFLNVVIARLPLGQSIVQPGSHCFSCGHAVRPWDNVPIVSYLVLRGRCRHCGVRFSPRYLLIEALTAVMSAAVYWKFVAAAPEQMPVAVRMASYAVYFAFVGVLIALSVIDLDTKRLPDVITLPAIPVLFLGAFGAHAAPWLDRLIGLAAGYLLVRIVADVYYYVRGREGLGLGDGKLLAVVGAVLGWRAIPAVIFMASFTGILVSVPLLLARHRSPRPPPDPAATPAATPPGSDAGAPEPEPPSIRHTEVPFGPFLSASAIVVLLAGDSLWRWLLARLDAW